jgi:lysozyme
MAAMTFQLGVSGVMAFKRLLAALERGDWPAAAAEMLDSKWAKEDSPARARRMAAAMASGEVAAFELPKNTAELS